MQDLVVVKTYPSRIEAEIGRGALEAQSIYAIVTADDAGGMYPFPLSPTTGGVQLLVQEKDKEKAISILREAWLKKSFF